MSSGVNTVLGRILKVVMDNFAFILGDISYILITDLHLSSQCKRQRSWVIGSQKLLDFITSPTLKRIVVINVKLLKFPFRRNITLLPSGTDFS